MKCVHRVVQLCTVHSHVHSKLYRYPIGYRVLIPNTSFIFSQYIVISLKNKPGLRTAVTNIVRDYKQTPHCRQYGV